jgi:hypothetical protein
MRRRARVGLGLVFPAASLGVVIAIAAAASPASRPASRPASQPASAPATRPDTRKIIEADSADGFLRAIASDCIIRLKPGRYELTEANRTDQTHVAWYKADKEWGVRLHDLKNLKIEGLGEKPVGIRTRARFADVLRLAKVEGLELVNLELGHAPEAAPCGGSVLDATDSNLIVIRSCDLFGCGVEGLSLRGVCGLAFEKSVIRDCTEGVMSAAGCEGLVFRDSQFRGNRTMAAFSLEACGKVLMTNCVIENNKWMDGAGGFPLFDLVSGTEVTLEKCQVLRNTFNGLAKPAASLKLNRTDMSGNSSRAAGGK